MCELYPGQQADMDRGDALDVQAHDAYDLEQFKNSLEGRLIEFTDQELINEYYRRLFAPLKTELSLMADTIEKLTAPF